MISLLPLLLLGGLLLKTSLDTSSHSHLILLKRSPTPELRQYRIPAKGKPVLLSKTPLPHLKLPPARFLKPEGMRINKEFFNPYRSVVLSPKGRYLALSLKDDALGKDDPTRIETYDVKTNEYRETIQDKSTVAFYWCAWQTEGKLLYNQYAASSEKSQHWDISVKSYDLSTRQTQLLHLTKGKPLPYYDPTFYFDKAQSAVERFQRLDIQQPARSEGSGLIPTDLFGIYASGYTGAISEDATYAVGLTYDLHQWRYIVIRGEKKIGTITYPLVQKIVRLKFLEKHLVVLKYVKNTSQIDIWQLAPLSKVGTVSGDILVDNTLPLKIANSE